MQGQTLEVGVPLVTAAGHIYPVTYPDQCIYMKLLDSMTTADLSSTLCGNHVFVLVLWRRSHFVVEPLLNIGRSLRWYSSALNRDTNVSGRKPSS